MNKQDLIKMATDFLLASEDNYVNGENALSEQLVGMQIYEAPVFGFADAGDDYFSLLQDPASVGRHFRLPDEWLPGAKTVISFFLPYTETIKRSNSQANNWPSREWLHGRFEGQAVLKQLTAQMHSEMIAAGYPSVIPPQEKEFWVKVRPDGGELSFTTNWSERHVAYVCGLGTFGLSGGLITKKGMAGRFGSIVTQLYLEPMERDYAKFREYCSMCGACIRQCPVNAISYETGKDHKLCCDFLDAVKEKHEPRYGCGKCQSGVPCESGVPGV